MNISLNVVPCSPNFKPFYKATDGSACYDLYAARIEFTPGTGGKEVKVYFGFKSEFSEKYAMVLKPRSSFSNKGWVMANSPGYVDSDYRDEVYVVFQAIPFESGDGCYKPFPYKVGDRVIQMSMEIVPILQINYLPEGTKLSTSTRDGGFGSTGIK